MKALSLLFIFSVTWSLAPTPSFAQTSAPAATDVAWLQNESARLGFSAATGRLVDFRLTDHDNVLWLAPDNTVEKYRKESGWSNYGGDKIWILFEGGLLHALGRTFPQDEYIDGLPWNILEQSTLRLVVQSPISPHVQAQVTRTIELDAHEPRVIIHNRIERLAASPFALHIWSISQAVWPESFLLDIDPRAPSPPNPWHRLCGSQEKVASQVTPHKDYLSYTPKPDGSYGKIGTIGSWIAAIYPAYIFVQSIANLDPFACYSDGASVEIFHQTDYIELETLSPYLHLQPGQSMENTLTWALLKRRPGEAPVDHILRHRSEHP